MYKLRNIISFVIALLLLGVFFSGSAQAYKRICLDMGEKDIYGVACTKQCCIILCATDNNYPTNPALCNDVPMCSCDGSTGGGPTTENIPYVSITSPVKDNYYSQNTITLAFSVSSITSISKITYKIDALAQVMVCNGNCNLNYNIQVPQQPSTLSDGVHTIKVEATASDGKVNPLTSVGFYIDTQSPVIHSTLPADGSDIAGSSMDSFSLDYTEANLKQVSLYYKPESAPSFSLKNITCTSGTGKVCTTTLDLHSLPQCSKLSYYFKLEDPFTSAQSPTATVNIISNPTDTDSDSLPDVCDNCPSASNADQLDSDGDKIGNACDQYPDDKDNDGIDDSSDRIWGTASDIETDTITPGIYMDDQPAPDQPTGIQHVEIKNGARTIMEFDMDFDSSILDLTTMRIDTQRGSTGSIIISGLNLNGGTKTVYLDRLNPGSNKVCIKDAEISSLSEISGNCAGSDEYLITCDGLIHSGFNCSLSENSRYRVTGLRHSGVMEYSTCTENWQCNAWDNCQSSSTQTRTCTDSNNCGTTTTRPSLSQGCTYTAPATGGGGGGGGGGSSGGGGGGGGASLMASESQYFPKIEAGSTGSVKITNSDKLAITDVYLKVLTQVEGAKVTLKESSLPSSVAAPIVNPQGSVYLYLQITRGEISTESIDKVNLNFKVSKDWLTKNKYSQYDIMMVRYLETQKTWQELRTSRLKEDLNYVYYTAESPGFSTFAIISKIGSGVQPETKPVVNTTSQKNQTAAMNQTAKLNTTAVQQNTTKQGGLLGITGMAIADLTNSPVAIGIVIFLVIIIIMLLVVIRSGKKSVEFR